MAFSPVRNLVATVAEATPAQFDDWRKSWRAAADAGSAESLLTFVARERGVAEDVFMQRLATALSWVEFRRVYDFLSGRPRLAHWYAALCNRPSMLATTLEGQTRD